MRGSQVESLAPSEGDVAVASERVSAEPDETATAPRVMTGVADDKTPDETPDEAPSEPALAAAELEEVETLEPEASRDPGPISVGAEETAGMSPAPLEADDGSPSEESER